MAAWHSNLFKSGCSVDTGFGLHKGTIEKDVIDRQGRLYIKNDTEYQAKKFGLRTLVYRQWGNRGVIKSFVQSSDMNQCLL